MRRRPSPDRLLMKRAVAYGLSLGYTQKQLALTLKLGEPMVSRLRKEATDERLLVDRPPRCESLTEEEKQVIESMICPGRLHELLQRAADRARRSPVSLHVYHSGDDSASRDDWDRRIDQFARAAAACVLGLLERAQIAGVAWGSTVSGVVQGLRDLEVDPPRRKRPVRFIPVCGEPLGLTPTQVSASTLAADLDMIVNGGHAYSFSLGGVPALIPLALGQSDVEAVRRCMVHVEAFREIFGSPGGPTQGEPWIERLDTILTSFADSSQSLGFWDHRLAGPHSGVDIAMLRAHAVGDIAGALISRQARIKESGLSVGMARPTVHGGSAERKGQLVSDIDARWLGIKLQHVEQCARRARAGGPEGPPGVIIVAIGRNKAGCLRKIIDDGLVNVLIIDHDLAQGLEDEMRRPELRPDRGGPNRGANPRRR